MSPTSLTRRPHTPALLQATAINPLALDAHSRRLHASRVPFQPTRTYPRMSSVRTNSIDPTALQGTGEHEAGLGEQFERHRGRLVR